MPSTSERKLSGPLQPFRPRPASFCHEVVLLQPGSWGKEPRPTCDTQGSASRCSCEVRQPQRLPGLAGGDQRKAKAPACEVGGQGAGRFPDSVSLGPPVLATCGLRPPGGRARAGPQGTFGEDLPEGGRKALAADEAVPVPGSCRPGAKTVL